MGFSNTNVSIFECWRLGVTSYRGVLSSPTGLELRRRIHDVMEQAGWQGKNDMGVQLADSLATRLIQCKSVNTKKKYYGKTG